MSNYYLDDNGLTYFIEKLYDIFATQKMVQNEVALINGDVENVTDPFNLIKTGKIYTTKVWHYNSNSTSDCVKMDDNEGLVCNPSTNLIEGVDDYASIPLFQWFNCNYVRDRWGCARLTYLEGEEGYTTSGAVDVGVISPMMYIKYTDTTDYELWQVSDTQHDNSWVPWIEGVTKDNHGNTLVLPYYIGSKYYSGIASDGLLRSQPGLAPDNTPTYENMITNYQRKGAGYWGAGSEMAAFFIIMNYIKYGTKNSQYYNAGCTNYNYNYIATAANSNVEGVTLSKANADTLVVGSNVIITNTNSRTPPSYFALNAKITSIEDIANSNNAFVTIDNGGTKFSTTSSKTRLMTMPWISGSTDNVIGKHDGAIYSNSSGKYPCRIQGREYAVGGGCLLSNIVSEYDSSTTKRKIYVAERGVSHSTDTSVIPETYTLIGTSPASDVNHRSTGDVTIDLATGGIYPSAYASSDSQGFQDGTYYTTNTGYSIYYTIGGIGATNSSGVGHINWQNDFVANAWHYLSRD